MELNPYTVVGPANDKDERALRQDLDDAAREAFESAEDRDAWVRGVTVLVRNAEADTGATEWREVGTAEVRQENAFQAITFDPVTATHVKLRVDTNWGGERSKLGRMKVLTAPVAGAATDVANVGFKPNIGWQFLAYLLLTAAEIMVSITSLEFAYTQAPRKMKSFIMGIYFLGVSLGNLFTSAVNKVIQNEDGSSKLEGASYYWFFTILMVITAVIFVFVAMRYKGQRFVQGEDAEHELEAEAEAEGSV